MFWVYLGDSASLTFCSNLFAPSTGRQGRDSFNPDICEGKKEARFYA